MAKLLMLIISILVFISSVNAVTFYPFSTEDQAKIGSIVQYNSIIGNGLYSETIIEVNLINKTFVIEHPTDFYLRLDFLEQERYFSIDYLNVTICDGMPSELGSDYSHSTFNCSKPLNYILNNSNKQIEIKLNLSSLTEHTTVIKIDYRIPSDFLIKNGEFYVAWLKTGCNGNSACPNESSVIRYLKLPEVSSVLQDRNNFDIERMIDGRWVLKTEGYKDSIVRFKDSKDEFKDKSNWLLYGVILALISSLLFLLVEDYLKKVNNFFKGAPFLVFTFMFLSFFWFFHNPTQGNLLIVYLSLIPLMILWIGLVIFVIKIIYTNRKELKDRIIPYFKMFKFFKNKGVISEVKSELIIFPIVLILVLILSNFTRENYAEILNLGGLIILTYGAILAIRPIVRNLINPDATKRERNKMDINAGMMAFIQILIGFSLQMSSSLINLLKNFFDSNLLYTIIFTIAIFVLDWIFIKLTIQSLNFKE